VERQISLFSFFFLPFHPFAVIEKKKLFFSPSSSLPFSLLKNREGIAYFFFFSFSFSIPT